MQYIWWKKQMVKIKKQGGILTRRRHEDAAAWSDHLWLRVTAYWLDFAGRRWYLVAGARKDNDGPTEFAYISPVKILPVGLLPHEHTFGSRLTGASDVSLLDLFVSDGDIMYDK